MLSDPSLSGLPEADAGATPESDVLTGNYHDKYGSGNPAIRWLTDRFLAQLDAVMDEIAAGYPISRVLEIGCGEGEITRRLRARWPDVTAIDLPAQALRASWADVPGPHFCHADAANLPFADNAFDLVVGIEVLEHTPQPSLCLLECARVSRGHLVFSVPREPLFRLGNLAAGRHVRHLGNTPGHLQNWSSSGFQRLVSSAGHIRAVKKPLPWTVTWVSLDDGRPGGGAGAQPPDEQPAPEVAGDSELQSEAMRSRHGAPRYQRWLTSLAVDWLGDRPLEIGSGLGDNAADWAAQGFSVTASEADPVRLRQLHERFEQDPRVEVRRVVAPISETADYSAVVTYNVLEHLSDDVGALRGFAGLVRPGGYVITLVPASPLAMSSYDRQIGHYRRYRRSTLRAALQSAGLEVVRLHHVNAPGLLLWLVTMRLLKLRRTGRSVSRGLRLYDRLVPVIRAVESRFSPPVGQSLFAVARVPGRL